MNRHDKTEHKLTLAEVLDMLLADGMIEQAQHDALITARRGQRHDSHPLVLVAEQNWKSLTPPNKAMHLEALTEWMAQRTGLEYFHIDPLKIDFTTVTDIMSSDYAARFGILPVQVTASEVVIATSEPFLREWEKVLKPILRKDIRRVVATPTDISRYLVEFYNLARSVKSAEKNNRSGTSSQASFEQLVEMGKSNRQFDANDQNIVHIVDWLWQ
jgi:general secretion pathway protein E